MRMLYGHPTSNVVVYRFLDHGRTPDRPFLFNPDAYAGTSPISDNLTGYPFTMQGGANSTPLMGIAGTATSGILEE